jgi:hypothetical protein
MLKLLMKFKTLMVFGLINLRNPLLVVFSQNFEVKVKDKVEGQGVREKENVNKSLDW